MRPFLLLFVLLGHPAPAQITHYVDSVEVHRTDTIYFAFGSDELTETARTQVQRLVADRPGELELYLEGHTDAVGTDTSNDDLAKRRSQRTLAAAIAAGWPAEAVEIRHFGEKRLVVNTTAPEPRNRRVLLRSGLPRRYAAFHGLITDETGNPIPGGVIAHGQYLEDTVRAGADGSYVLYLPLDEDVRLDIFARNHFYTSRTIKLSEATAVREPLTTALPAATAGKRMSIEDLYFVGNRTEFIPESVPTLERLLHFMRFSPDLYIELAGHVNFPGEAKGPTTWQYRLAQNRARVVADYLIHNGINPERLRAKGYSNFEMVNPKPRNEVEMRANRRVEIRIRDNSF